MMTMKPLMDFLCCMFHKVDVDDMFESCLFRQDRQEIYEVMSGYHHTPATMAKLQRPSDSCTLLLVASVAGDATLVELLLEEGDPTLLLTADDAQGNSPLLCACLGGHARVVEVLLQEAHNQGSCQDLATRPNQEGTTPLIAAAWRGHLEIVKQLAPLPGMKLTTQDSLGRTAKDLAGEWGHSKVVQWIDHNAHQPEGDWENI